MNKNKIFKGLPMKKYLKLFLIVSIGAIIGKSVSLLLVKFNTEYETLLAIITALSITIIVMIYMLVKYYIHNK